MKKTVCRFSLALVAISLLSSCTSVRDVLFPPKPAIMADRAIIPPPIVRPRSIGRVAEMPREVDHTDVEITRIPEVDLTKLDDLEPPEVRPEVIPIPRTTEIELPPPTLVPEETYTVKKNDSFWKIAWMYGVSFQELAAHNSMGVDDILPVGKVLRIPPGGRYIPENERPPLPKAKKEEPKKATGSPKATTTTKVSKQTIPADGKYTVAQNDNLWVISRRYGVSISDIKKLNNLKTEVLQIGQVLILKEMAKPQTNATSTRTTKEAPKPLAAADPDKVQKVTPTPAVGGNPAPEAGTPSTTSFPQTLDHTVTQDETLQSIADMYETTVGAIKAANPNVKSDANLKPHMTLVIPYK